MHRAYTYFAKAPKLLPGWIRNSGVGNVGCGSKRNTGLRMAKILIAYSTTDGHTRKICERIKQLIEERAHTVTLEFIDDEPELELDPFDTIVIGASIRYGKHRPQVYEFIRKNRQILESKPTAFFSVNVVARKPEKNSPDTNPYLKKFLRQLSWKPQVSAVFAGKINYPIYTFWDRQVIRFIMWITNGPTDPQAVEEFTDWTKVDDFGRVIADM
jgi:menaquinone-dependent protoporphyrinogen oxidase